MTTERRDFELGLELRAQDGKPLVATGYAAVFGKRSLPLGRDAFVEVVSPRAFRKTLKEADVLALFNHDPAQLLGRTDARTLRLSVDEEGLRYEVDLPDTTLGRDVAELLRRGDLQGSSFGFQVIRDSWAELEDGTPLRTLEEVRLFDVGPVTSPAYPDASAALRSLAEARSVDPEVLRAAAEEGHLRGAITAPDPAETEPPTRALPRRARRVR